MFVFSLPWIGWRAAKKAAAPSSSLTILIVDDNRDAVSTLTELLVAEGHVVRSAHSGLEALRVDLEHKPQVVILDLRMPDIDGYDVARWLRSRHHKRCPVLIAISGEYTQPADREFAQVCGFDHYLAKPYDFRQLVSFLSAPRRQQLTTRSQG